MLGIRQSDDLVHFIATFYDSSKFWEEVRELQEDIEFFSLYMRRNKKSNFNLSLRSYNFKFFNALWQNYGWSEDSSVVEWIYGLHIATKVIMNNFLATYYLFKFFSIKINILSHYNPIQKVKELKKLKIKLI